MPVLKKDLLRSTDFKSYEQKLMKEEGRVYSKLSTVNWCVFIFRGKVIKCDHLT